MKLVSKKDSAVSPVIGTILLVAITVILVAIIAAVVMPMVGSVGQAHISGIQVSPNSTADATTYTFVSGEMPDSVTITGPTTPTVADADKKAVIGKVYTIKSPVNKGASYSIVGNFGKDTQVLWTGVLMP